MPEDIKGTINQCASCHGLDGNSNIKTIPSFAGSSEEYFKYAMEMYKNGSRPSDIMKSFTENLTSEQLDKLAAYYSRQPFKVVDQPYDERLAEEGKELHDQYCEKCHGNSGYVDPYYYGILAGQWMPYLNLAIEQYLEGTRKTNDMMRKKIKRVQDEAGNEGLEKLIHYYASIKQQ
ncbi:MAG: c-type cytochrome [Gammaproteobacteria bacterium]